MEPRVVKGLPVGPPRLGVVLVNYRRADDTIECLESLFRSTIALQVAVVDNQSEDGSLDAIADWAAGARRAQAASPEMAAMISPPLRKPLPVRRLTATDAARQTPAAALSLIDAGRNGGFAAGNNLGLAHLLQHRSLDYFWLLNNDTVVEPLAAAALLERLDAVDRVGMCGTVVRYYWRPDTVQALNGHSFRFRDGSSRGLGAGQPATTPFNPRQIAERTDFVLGASLAVSRPFLRDIGPMDEGYFLYFEEIDWAARNDGRYRIAFAHAATIYHKEGGSIGSSGKPGERSGFSDYWLTRSRLRFIRRHRPLLLPLHWLVTLATVARRLWRRQFGKAGAVLRALFGSGY